MITAADKEHFQSTGLYDPANEHDACGVAMVVDMHGRRSRDIVDKAITALLNLEHRGATGAEVLAYFERLMRERLLPTGRVRWFPSHQYRQGDDGSHRIVCLATGAEQVVKVRRKRVDATHARTEVPSVRRPAYGLADGVDCISIGGLTKHVQAIDLSLKLGPPPG